MPEASSELLEERETDMEDHCAECRYDGRWMSNADVQAALTSLASQIGTLVRSADDGALRAQPRPGTWSVIEYLGHLRDLMAFHRFVIERAIAEDTPSIANVDPDEFVAAANLRAADRDELLGQFERRVDRLTELLSTLSAADLDRPVLFEQPSPAPPVRHDARLVSRSAVHEAVHHRGDIERLLAR
ncbi:MAG: DinB family protein [Acidimicrobiia bacterium]